MDDIKVKVGAMIREVRKAKGLTQKDMGKLMNMTEAAYNRYESGIANPSLGTIEKIVKAMGVGIKIIIE